MFFNLHSEGKIGYKKLTDADLGTGTSHQTHIGLFGDIFTFLFDREVEKQAMLIYDNKCTFVDCYFDRIENPDGSFRSPKIKKGERNAVSVVTCIRDKVRTLPLDYDWYLIWFGLENEDMVFYFFNNHSIDYNTISKFLDIESSGRVDKKSQEFDTLISYLGKIVDESGIEIIKELEVASQVDNTVSQVHPEKRYRQIDLENANKIFKETGRRGEELIAEYLDRLKTKKQIFNYLWVNKSLESGLPYDFSIQENNQNIIHVDVKSTLYRFEQKLIFSGQEIEFITQIPNYKIYRVYNLSDEESESLRICDDSKQFASNINPLISDFHNKIQSLEAELHSVKLAVSPIIKDFVFRPELMLRNS